MNHVLTVDVEEYFQVVNLESVVPRSAWPGLESRLEIGIDKLIDLLTGHGAGATFFVLGCVAERQPALLRRIAGAGFEVGSHGYDHRRLDSLGEEGFGQDLRRAEEAIGAATGAAVRAYRAPHFSLNLATLWAFDVLADRGYTVDSSVFPGRHPEYGVPRAPRRPFTLELSGGRAIHEFPVAVVGGRTLPMPVSGGAYLRHLPYPVTRTLLRRLHRQNGAPFTLFTHPWELDLEQPRLDLPLWRRWRQYHGLESVEGKLRNLLGEFRFASLSAAVATTQFERVAAL